MSRQTIKILAAMLVSLFFTLWITNAIFLVSTPKINRNFLLSLLSKPSPTPALMPIIPLPSLPPQTIPSILPKKILPTPTTKPTPTILFTPTPTTPLRTQSPTLIPKVQQLSSSKLGIFILSSYSDGAKSIITAGPRVIKVMDPQANSSIMQSVKDYKNNFPNGKVVLRIYISAPGNDVNTNPIDVAQNIFQKYLQPALNQLGENIKYFDYLETPNESEQTPDWDTIEKVEWHNQFWMRLADLNYQAGIKTCAGSISVGGVGGATFEEIGQHIAAFVPALRYLKQIGGAWCYHGYTIKYTTDENTELWYSLRYRIFYQYLQKNAPDVADIPMVISEGGVDLVGDPKTSGWQARGKALDFENWLTWYDSEIKKDQYIIGVTLFQIGDGHWSSFNLEPISSWLANFLMQRS